MAKPKMTTAEVMQDMRRRNFSITYYSLIDGAEAGIFPFVRVLGEGKTGRKNLLILRREYEQWADEFLGGVST